MRARACSEWERFESRCTEPPVRKKDERTMGTLTSLMNLSREALMADQEALNITANNVANQNTPGYTRQVANWQSVDLVTINGVSYGGGVSVSAVSQRDRILEQRVQQQTQVQA